MRKSSYALGLLIGLTVACGCQPTGKLGSPTPKAPATGLQFSDQREKSGINFTFELRGSRPITILRSMPGGCAFLDYDGDGNLDVLCISYKVALFRGDGKGHFTDVTAAAGLTMSEGWWMGCAVGS